MNKVEKKVDLDHLHRLLGQLLEHSAPGPAISQIAEKLNLVEYLHPEDFPASGGLFILTTGEVDIFIRSYSSAGLGQPYFIKSLAAGSPICLCPLGKSSSRILNYAPTTAVQLYSLAWKDLVTLLEGDIQTANILTGLIAKANSSLAQALTGAALNIPRERKGSLPKIPEPINGKFILESAGSLEALAKPLVSVLDQLRKDRFEDYLKRAGLKEREEKEEAVASLIALRHPHRTMPLIPAHDPETAWDAVVAMVAKYEGNQRLPKSGTKLFSKTSKDPVSWRASDYGLRMRYINIRSGNLQGLGRPIIAVTKEGNPLVLEPGGKYIWVHDPLKGSYRILTEKIEEKLSELAYELISELDKGLAKPARIIDFALSGLSAITWRVIWVSVLIVILGILTPIATNWIFGYAVPSAHLNVLHSIGLVLISSAIAAAVFNMFRGMVILNLVSLATSRISSALWSHIFRLPIRFFRKYRVGDLSLRLQAVDQIRQQLTYAVINIGVNGLFSLVYLAVMTYYSWKLCLYGLGIAIIVIIILLAGMNIVSKRLREMFARKADEESLLYETIRNILTVRTSAAAKRIYSRWLKLLAAEMEMSYKSDLAKMWPLILFGSIPVLGTLLMYWRGGGYIIADKFPLSKFLAFNVAFTIFLNAVITACQELIELTNVGPLWDRARPVLEAAEERPAGGVDPGKLQGHIEVKDCSFRYTDDAPEIISGISFAVSPGEFIAITGPSGAGKTTLVRLLLAFESPSNGQILYDRYDLQDLDLQSIRRQVGVVLQQNELLSASIRENLIINAPLASQEEIEEAAKSADIHDDIMAMPMRYETIITEGGATFSGGQRQRLAIARALVPKPKILFFDEATSALDNVSQERIEKSLAQLKATRIIIAHRLSTIEKADRIIVIAEGKIVQEGSFQKLMAQEGLFREMVKRQQI